MNAASAQAQADRLLREARDHKRASRTHRDKAREKRQELDALIVACAARGIQITINAQPKGGHSVSTQQNGHAATQG